MPENSPWSVERESLELIKGGQNSVMSLFELCRLNSGFSDISAFPISYCGGSGISCGRAVRGAFDLQRWDWDCRGKGLPQMYIFCGSPL